MRFSLPVPLPQLFLSINTTPYFFKKWTWYGSGVRGYEYYVMMTKYSIAKASI